MATQLSPTEYVHIFDVPGGTCTLTLRASDESFTDGYLVAVTENVDGTPGTHDVQWPAIQQAAEDLLRTITSSK